MNKYSKLIYELYQMNLEDHEFNDLVLKELLTMEKEILQKLEDKEEVDPEDLICRDKLNKLASQLYPHTIEIYDIEDIYKKKEEE